MDDYYLRIKCYHCGSIMEAWDHSAGKRSRCPNCDAPMKVPHFKYFEQFNGKKVLAVKIPDWKHSNPWKPENHPLESKSKAEPTVKVKETDDGSIVELKNSQITIEQKNQSAKSENESGSAIKPTMYDFEDDDDSLNDDLEFFDSFGNDDEAETT